eukprot:Amastigsp_a175561_10.p2 type:complete len:286 gc:universal Amastigsp_a175561_10:1-858(+)
MGRRGAHGGRPCASRAFALQSARCRVQATVLAHPAEARPDRPCPQSPRSRALRSAPSRRGLSARLQEPLLGRTDARALMPSILSDFGRVQVRHDESLRAASPPRRHLPVDEQRAALVGRARSQGNEPERPRHGGRVPRALCAHGDTAPGRRARARCRRSLVKHVHRHGDPHPKQGDAHPAHCYAAGLGAAEPAQHCHLSRARVALHLCLLLLQPPEPHRGCSQRARKQLGAAVRKMPGDLFGGRVCAQAVPQRAAACQGALRRVSGRVVCGLPTQPLSVPHDGDV